ncbi:MAG TPA: hypothetical protein PLG73_17005, partial [Candidatus Sumerlaeota bacterium]|nr:hypothetical protein [Candidatus Sumerlaeota bacterium]
AGMVLLLGFGAWPFLRLAGVPPLRVLRREPDASRVSPWIALAIAVGALWGIAQGEWRNTSAATRRLMLGGVAVLVLAIFVFAYSGSL